MKHEAINNDKIAKELDKIRLDELQLSVVQHDLVTGYSTPFNEAI